MEQEFKREYFKEKYDFFCCDCGYKQWAKPSMSMTGLGRNSGHGSCINCKKFLHLEIEGGLDGENMVSVLWDDFMKSTKKTEKLSSEEGGKDEGNKTI